MRLSICAAFAVFLLAGTAINAAPFPMPGGGELPVPATSTSTTRVENVFDPLLKPYQQSIIGDCGTENCQVQLPATTHANTLIVHASCTFAAANNSAVVAAALSVGG